MSDTQQLRKTDRDELAVLSKAWGLPVAVGVLLMIYSFVVLSFTMSTVYAISVGLGIGLFLSGLGQLILWRSATSWRWLVLVSALIDIGLGIAAFAWPGATLLVLARLLGWVLLLRGIISIMQSFEARRLGDAGWWMLMVLGTFNIGVAFWASRYAGRGVVLLVLWVGLALMTRGLIAIAAGFALRSVGKELKTA
ncbi:MAG: DUF308 domain-containing protein [Actinomycetota bacterium]|jgi:uncharacterized membrane protein HdeD (DUF308 family)